MNTVELLDWAIGCLGSAGILSARYDSEIILSSIVKTSRLDLYMERRTIEIAKRFEFESIVEKRAERIPLQYILGNANFMGFDFRVKPGVFIPRPETELLVEEALKILNLSPLEYPEMRWIILDLCSGCGNISISLTKSISNCRMLAIDTSPDALDIARENAKLHGVGERIEFYEGDMFNPLNDNMLDMIISNPPYIPTKLLDNLSPEVKLEPRIAIDGGDDGLAFYKRIISECMPYLREGGWLLMEVGDDQAEEIRSILQESRVFNVHQVIKDYNGMMRVIIARKGRKQLTVEGACVDKNSLQLTTYS